MNEYPRFAMTTQTIEVRLTPAAELVIASHGFSRGDLVAGLARFALEGCVEAVYPLPHLPRPVVFVPPGRKAGPWPVARFRVVSRGSGFVAFDGVVEELAV